MGRWGDMGKGGAEEEEEEEEEEQKIPYTCETESIDLFGSAALLST